MKTMTLQSVAKTKDGINLALTASERGQIFATGPTGQAVAVDARGLQYMNPARLELTVAQYEGIFGEKPELPRGRLHAAIQVFGPVAEDLKALSAFVVGPEARAKAEAKATGKNVMLDRVFITDQRGIPARLRDDEGSHGWLETFATPEGKIEQRFLCDY